MRLIAGIGSGLGQAFQQSASTTSISPLGSTSSVKQGEEFKAGISSGVGKAMDRLAQYYIALAEKLYPVVEVDAGRMVDVVITKGAMLPMGEAGADNTTDPPPPSTNATEHVDHENPATCHPRPAGMPRLGMGR
jgi:hypothetical protein